MSKARKPVVSDFTMFNPPPESPGHRRCWGCARFVKAGRDYCDECLRQEDLRQQREIGGTWL